MSHTFTDLALSVSILFEKRWLIFFSGISLFYPFFQKISSVEVKKVPKKICFFLQVGVHLILDPPFGYLPAFWSACAADVVGHTTSGVILLV
jgi:hypothetical protein